MQSRWGLRFGGDRKEEGEGFSNLILEVTSQHLGHIHVIRIRHEAPLTTGRQKSQAPIQEMRRVKAVWGLPISWGKMVE